jgi:hypothetical protein
MRCICFALALFSAAAALLQADVTIRYSMSIEPGAALPPQAVAQVKSQMKDLMSVSNLQVKGNRARSTMGAAEAITDFDGLIITLVDDAKKQYATASQRQYAQAMKDQIPKNTPETQKILEGVKMETSARKTGQTRTINGFEASETEVTLSMQMPGTPLSMRNVMSMWSATPAATEKNASLKELAAYSQRAWEGTGMISTMRSIMQGMPGASPAMAKMVESLKDAGVLLEMKATVSMPGMMEMLRKINPQAAADLPAGGDDVMMTMTQKLEELSSAEIPESRFVVPRDYTAISLPEIIGKLMPSVKPKPQ